MNLRTKVISLRIRVTQSDLVKLIDTGCVEEAIYFTPDE
jgi:hypothetical protein